jgi:hypothetical protein
MDYQIEPKWAKVGLHSNSKADESELNRVHEFLRSLPKPIMTPEMVRDETMMENIIHNLGRLYGNGYELRFLGADIREYSKGDFRYKKIEFTVFKDGISQETLRQELKLLQI